MTKARTLADNFAADINGITAGTGITGGGTSGTVTVTNSMATAIDAKGDLVVGTGADTFSRLAVASTAGYLLSVDSAEATGLKWAAPAGGALVKISNTSFSNVATQDFDGVFTATYTDYLVVVNSIASATNTDTLWMRLKYGSTVQASQYYQFRATFTTLASVAQGQYNQIEIGVTGDTGGVPKGCYHLWMHNIDGTARNPSYYGTGVDAYGTRGFFYGGGWQGTPTAFDGFRLLSSSTNITGNVTIYGVVR